MREIDYKKWENCNNIVEVYDDIINLAYSQNYNLLLKYERYERGKDKAGILGIGFSESILKADFKVAKENRQDYFNNIFLSIQRTKAFIENNFREIRSLFYAIYSTIYNDNEPFSQTFVGLDSKNNKFKEDLSGFLEGKLKSDDLANMAAMFNFYNMYSYYVVLALNLDSLSSIISNLYDDFTNDGYKKNSFGKPNKGIATITKDEINGLEELLDTKIRELEAKQKVLAKTFKKEDKAMRKLSPTPKYLPSWENARADLHENSEYLLAIKNLRKRVEIYENRFDYANEYVSLDEVRRKVDRFENVISLGLRNPRLIDKVYYHKGEMTLLYQYSEIFPEFQKMVKILLDRAGGFDYLEELGEPENDIKVLFESDDLNNLDFDNPPTPKDLIKGQQLGGE